MIHSKDVRTYHRWDKAAKNAQTAEAKAKEKKKEQRQTALAVMELEMEGKEREIRKRREQRTKSTTTKRKRSSVVFSSDDEGSKRKKRSKQGVAESETEAFIDDDAPTPSPYEPDESSSAASDLSSLSDDEVVVEETPRPKKKKRAAKEPLRAEVEAAKTRLARSDVEDAVSEAPSSMSTATEERTSRISAWAASARSAVASTPTTVKSGSSSQPSIRTAAIPATPYMPARATNGKTKPPVKQVERSDAGREARESAGKKGLAATKSKGSKRLLDESEKEENPKRKRAKQDPVAHGGMHLKRQSSGKSKDVSGLGRKGGKVVKHEKVPVDPMSGFVGTHQVLVTEEGIWDAMLNQTNIGKNANKYYILQVLHPPEDDTWPPEMAIKQFKKQFRSKSGVPWENRFGMNSLVTGRYVWLERAYDDDDDKSSGTRKQLTAQSSKQDDDAEPIPDSVLPPEVQRTQRLSGVDQIDFERFRLLNAHLSSMNYDVNKRPLGKLAKSTILSGFTALKAGSLKSSHNLTEKLLDRTVVSNRQSMTSQTNITRTGAGRGAWGYGKLSSGFSPRDCNASYRRTVASEVIESAIPKDSDGRPMNPLDARFRMLQLSKMEPIPRSSPEFAALVAYAQNTDHTTDSHSTAAGSSRDLAQQPVSRFDVLHAFRVEREHETNAWLKAGFDKLPDGNRLLLWHGSRTTNFVAPVTGYMFGKGVYFADMMYKSAKFCHADVGDKTGLLLLCDVASKPFYEQYQENLRAAEECKEAGALSTKGMGRSQPTDWTCAGMCLRDHDLRGCHMPIGPAEEVTDPKGVFKLHHNEVGSVTSHATFAVGSLINFLAMQYIVYDVSQIRLRYLLMVKMG
ncbi:hypothetical protein NUW54_g6555 [Trametes sanguinea]|uniref:Uncharacterized protein n=1 Tax=Trametes sanguinea TaxID=158606 RepID=A0ACC1PRX0_9APHY|nr:hypothetical protein NUW54_g6555 [Trametes sanguinea]